MKTVVRIWTTRMRMTTTYDLKIVVKIWTTRVRTTIMKTVVRIWTMRVRTTSMKTVEDMDSEGEDDHYEDSGEDMDIFLPPPQKCITVTIKKCKFC